MMDIREAYRRVLLIRRVEEAIAERYGELNMRTPVHLSLGQEGGPVGVLMALPSDTHVYASHRNHAAYLAHGCDLNAMIAELYGKATGCTGGRGGSMHLWSEEPFFMAHPIVGDSISLAVGSAMAAKMDGSNRWTVAFMGDAAAESGQFWESLNFAALHSLRILFVCENNRLATQTPIGARQPPGSIASRVRPWVPAVAMAYAHEVDRVYKQASMLTELAAPAFLELHTSRWKEHVGPMEDSTQTDRDYSMDALDYLDKLLDNQGTMEEGFDIEAAVVRAFALAEAAPWPEVAA